MLAQGTVLSTFNIHEDVDRMSVFQAQLRKARDEAGLPFKLASPLVARWNCLWPNTP